VLKGETLSSTPLLVSGAKVDLEVGSAECDLLKIFGFPARFMGGGIGGPDVMACDFVLGSRSMFAALRGSPGLDTPGLGCKKGADFISTPGVPLRLGSLKCLGSVE
jgi:hypothetical protein